MTEREEELARLLAEALRQNEVLLRENTLLRQKVDALVRRVFGSSSEQVDPAQLLLFLQGQAGADVAAVVLPAVAPSKAVDKTREHKPRLPEHLPVVEEVIDPDAVKAQPQAWRCIGQEVSEQLDYQPGRFFRRRTIRRKYVHKTGGGTRPSR